MTLAELILFIAIVCFIYKLLKPVRLGLERILRKYFHANPPSGRGTIIDVTHIHSKKKDPE